MILWAVQRLAASKVLFPSNRNCCMHMFHPFYEVTEAITLQRLACFSHDIDKQVKFDALPSCLAVAIQTVSAMESQVNVLQAELAATRATNESLVGERQKGSFRCRSTNKQQPAGSCSSTKNSLSPPFLRLLK